jgi:hypothetical protein
MTSETVEQSNISPEIAMLLSATHKLLGARLSTSLMTGAMAAPRVPLALLIWDRPSKNVLAIYFQVISGILTTQ